MKKTTKIILAAIIALLLCASFSLGMNEGFLNFEIFWSPAGILDNTDTFSDFLFDSNVLECQDRFIGFFITTEEIDFNKICEDYPGNYSGRTEDCVSRIYADTTPGEDDTFETISFPGCKGIMALNYVSKYIDDTPVLCSYGDAHNIHYGTNISDTGTEQSFEATIYTISSENDEKIHDIIYEVFQTDSGAIYIPSQTTSGFNRLGSASFWNTHSKTEKTRTADPITGEHTTKEETIKYSVKIKIEMLDNYTTKLIVKEMSEDDVVLSSSEFNLTSLPDEYVAGENAAYLLFERELIKDDGSLEIAREITPRGDWAPDFFIADEQGYGIRQHFTIDWGEEVE